MFQASILRNLKKKKKNKKEKENSKLNPKEVEGKKNNKYKNRNQ